MAELDPGAYDLAELIKRLGSAAEVLAESQATLEKMHEVLGSSDGDGATPDVIEAAQVVAGAAGEFGDSLTERERALAASLDALEKTAQDAAGEAGFPAASASMASAASGFTSVTTTAARDVGVQADALRDQGLAHVLGQVEASTASSEKARALVLTRMEGLRTAAREGLGDLTGAQGMLAETAREAAQSTAQQASEVAGATRSAADAVAAACRRAVAAWGTRRDDLETIFRKRQGELEAEAVRLESGVATLLSERTAEVQAAIQALSGPVETALETGLRALVEELGAWRTRLESLAAAAEGLDTLAGELKRARRVMDVAGATLDAMGPA